MIPSGFNIQWHMDLADFTRTPDTTSSLLDSYTWLCLVIERCSGALLVCAPMRAKSSREVARVLAPAYGIFGAPSILTTDGGMEFAGEVKIFLDACFPGTKHIVTSPRNPKANGPAENMVRQVKDAIRKLSEAGLGWASHLASIQRGQNEAPSRARGGLSPHSVVFGREPASSLGAVLTKFSVSIVDCTIEETGEDGVTSLYLDGRGVLNKLISAHVSDGDVARIAAVFALDDPTLKHTMPECFVRVEEAGAPGAGVAGGPLVLLEDGDGEAAMGANATGPPPAGEDGGGDGGEAAMAAHAAELSRQGALVNDRKALAALRSQAEYRKKLAYQDGAGVAVGSIVLYPVDNIRDRHTLDPDHLVGIVIRAHPSIRIAVSKLGPLKGTFSADQLKFAPAFQNPVLYDVVEVHAYITSLSPEELQLFADLPPQSVRAEFQRSSHFGDTRNTLGGEVQCSCSAGSKICKSNACTHPSASESIVYDGKLQNTE